MSSYLLAVTLTSVILTVCQDERGATIKIDLFPTSVIPVLRDEAFRKALHITDEQREKIDALLAPNLEAQRILTSRESQDLSPQEVRKQLDAARNRVSAEGLRAILDDRQFRRAQQILLQSFGYRVFYQPEIVSALRLDKQQRARFGEIRTEAVEAVRQDMLRSWPKSRSINDPDVRKKLWQQMTEVLDDEQREKLAGILGDPFDIDQLSSSRARELPRMPSEKPAK